ncbi:hypothetical protein NBRC116590_02320 [Pelagimonas sp. KU-00592-HH]|uniref:hypothetical protein n=1 Tax=Pelagimonas sp. KU-00592-HH TaxID=3127651 RepID=UPI0031055A44
MRNDDLALGFMIFATLNSRHLIPAFLVDTMSSMNRRALLALIAAFGMKTSLKRILDVGGQAIAVIVSETAGPAAAQRSPVAIKHMCPRKSCAA